MKINNIVQDEIENRKYKEIEDVKCKEIEKLFELVELLNEIKGINSDLFFLFDRPYEQKMKLLREFKYDDNVSLIPHKFSSGHNFKKNILNLLKQSNIIEIFDLNDKSGILYKKLNDFKEFPKEEGKAIDNTEIPLRMTANMKKITESKLWMPFVIHMHEEDGKLHKDFRMFIPHKNYGQVLGYGDAKELNKKQELNGILEGILISNDDIKIKQPQTSDWLFYEGIDDDGKIIISAHGLYTISKILPDEIEFILKSTKTDLNNDILKELKLEQTEPTSFDGHFKLLLKDGKWTFDKFFRPGPMPKVSAEQISMICKLREKHSIKEISNVTGLSRAAVYTYLSKTSSLYPSK